MVAKQSIMYSGIHLIACSIVAHYAEDKIFVSARFNVN